MNPYDPRQNSIAQEQYNITVLKKTLTKQIRRNPQVKNCVDRVPYKSAWMGMRGIIILNVMSVLLGELIDGGV